MTIEIVYRDMMNKNRSVFKSFKTMSEAYQFAHDNTRKGEYIGYIGYVPEKSKKHLLILV